MNTTPRYLITAADKRTWKNDHPIVFLGEWCRRDDRPEEWQSLDAIVAAPYGTSQSQLDEDTARVRKLEKTLFKVLVPMLNRHHQKQYSERYWSIVLGHWLRRYASVVFNRYQTFKQCADNYTISGVSEFPDGAYSLVTANSSTFVQACNDPVWNSVFWARIRQLTNCLRVPVEQIEAPDEKSFSLSTPPSSQSASARIRQLLESVSAKLSKKSNVFVINSYLPKKYAFQLHLALGQVPQLWSRDRPKIHEPAESPARQNLAVEMAAKYEEDIETIAATLLWETMPFSYLESLPQITELAENIGWPDNPKTIFTSNNYDSDDFFKVWTANRVMAGARYIIGQHGANVGTFRYSCSSVEEVIADQYITWGWSGDSPRHSKGFIFKYPRPGMLSRDPKGGLLLVEYPPSYQVYVHDQVVLFHKYFKDQTDFVTGLSKVARNQLTVRLPGVSKYMHENEKARWGRFDPNISIDSFEQEISQLIASSRLVIYSYDSTGILETLSQNIPVMAFWEGGFDHLRDSALPYYKALERAGILHFSAQCASKKVSEVYDDVDAWWFGDKVQAARRYFCNQYVVRVDDPISLLKSSLTS